MVTLSTRAYYGLPITLMMISSVIFLSYYQSESALPSYNGPFIENYASTSGSENGIFDLNINFTQTTFYKGESINFTVVLVVDSSIAYFQNLTIGVIEDDRELSANQSILIERSFQPGQYTLNLTLHPGFSNNGFLALVDKNYTLTDYYVFYHQGMVDKYLVKSLNHNLFGSTLAEYEQIQDREWDIHEQNNVIFERTATILNITSMPGISNITIGTHIQTSGYTRLVYDVLGLDVSILKLEIGNFEFTIDSGSSLGYIPLGNVKGLQNLSLSVNLIGNENLTISLEMKTHYLPIFIVIANNNWDTKGTSTDKFESPLEYLRVVSERFESTMNVSLIPVAMFDFEVSPLVNSLSTMRSNAENAAGNILDLVGGSWREIPGTHQNNNGADVLIIFTNRTMDHLGVVHKNENFENVNVAMLAQGSTHIPGVNPDDVEMRINPIWADNLLQHEFSHVFRAPDRWTDVDPPSIMTKSPPEYAYGDVILGEFWLFLTNWLEVDIQTMISNQSLYR